jgi:hypothetical protein
MIIKLLDPYIVCLLSQTTIVSIYAQSVIHEEAKHGILFDTDAKDLVLWKVCNQLPLELLLTSQ